MGDSSPIDGGTPASGADIKLGECFELLSSKRSRRVLAALRRTSSPVAVADLADRVVDGASEAEASPDRESVLRSLHHHHLPELAAADVLEYDRERGVVEPEPNADVVVRRWGAVVEGADGLDPEVPCPS